MDTAMSAASTPSGQVTGSCTVGSSVAARRRAAGLTQAELAALIGRSVAWVAKVEQGRRRADRLTDLINIASACRCGLGDLIERPAEQTSWSVTYEDGWMVIRASGGYVRVRGDRRGVELMTGIAGGAGAGDHPAVLVPAAAIDRLVEELRAVSGIPR